jgi:POT family proton-dependent oligopeptide transporter
VPQAEDLFMASSVSAEAPASAGFFSRYVFSHPPGFWFFFWGELAERCSYYGMRAILLLYMIDKLGFEKSSASMIMSYFIAAAYFLPLVGGWVADNYFGKYWTIVGFSLPYILGHVILGIENVTALFIALALLSMGSGVIKPNISTLMGLTYDQQRPGQDKLRSDAFAMFYGAINVGAFASSASMPWIRTHHGYAIAFLVPAGLMVIAFGIFAAGKRFYAVEVISRVEKTPEERALQWLTLRRLAGVFLVIIFFWAIFDQSASTWTLFANEHLDLNLFGYKIDPDQLQSLNPLLIVLLLPPVTVLWRVLGNWGWEIRTTDKMLLGFILTALSMGVMAVAGYVAVTQDVKVSVFWQVLTYLFITVAEICISPVGLELAFVAAPKSMKGFVTACFLLTVFFANIFNAQISALYSRMTPDRYFGMLTLMMVVVTGAFVVVANRFNRAATSWKTEEPAIPPSQLEGASNEV